MISHWLLNTFKLFSEAVKPTKCRSWCLKDMKVTCWKGKASP